MVTTMDTSKTSKPKLEKSQALYEEAKDLTPGGIHSNVRWMNPHPMYFKKASGSKIYDVDGNEYLDFISNYGALILGHGDTDVAASVKEHLACGLTTGMESELGIEVAKKMKKLVPCCERVRFSTSGTEAVMHAIHIARGYTGRERIVKFEGHYHGWYDYIFCSNRYPFQNWQLPKPYMSSQGLCSDAENSTLVSPWNDIEFLENLIEQHQDEIAAVIMEPVNHNIGCAMPKEGYLQQVRELTGKHNILLIFDEIITGFRVAPGGAQEYFGVTPDLATFGKAIANGFPLSAVGGKQEVMEVISPTQNKVAFGGTYNSNQLVMSAGLATLEKLQTGAVQTKLNRLTEDIVKGFNQRAAAAKVDARIQGLGGKFQVYFTTEMVDDWRTAKNSDEKKYRRFQEALFQKGILWSTSNFSHPSVTAAFTDEDINRFLQASEEILAGLADD